MADQQQLEREDEQAAEREAEHDESEGDREGDGDRQGIGGRILSASPLIWVLLAAAIAWALYTTLVGNSGGEAKARVVVLPPAEQERTVVALPCSSMDSMPSPDGRPEGAITAVLPPGGGERAVAVTGCSSGGGGAANFTGGGGRTVLVVPPSDVQLPGGGDGGSNVIPGMKITSVTRVADGIDARTIVIPPCPTRGAGGSVTTTRLQQDRTAGDVLLVPCPSTEGGGSS